MATPFYVSPEQVMKDRAEYARKGIARGRALVAVEYQDGVVFVGENPSRQLYKTSEIYDRIAFAAVGRYNEFEALRVAGINLADVQGYRYAREDVSAKALANQYSQALGAIFMGEGKPFEVEVLIAEVDGEEVPPGSAAPPPGSAELYHILYDGSIVDEHRFVAIGGESDALGRALESRYEDGLSLEAAVRLSVEALAEASQRRPPPADLEVSGLARSNGRRKFFRLDEDAIARMVETSA